MHNEHPHCQSLLHGCLNDVQPYLEFTHTQVEHAVLVKPCGGSLFCQMDKFQKGRVKQENSLPQA